MAKSAIEKFITNYIRNKKISESKEGYEAWLRKNGVDPTAGLSDSVGKAYAERERAASGNSDTAEALAESGLSDSGYAKYLSASIEDAKNENVSKAIAGYLATDTENKVGYSKELERLESIRIAEEKKAEEERKKAEEKAQEEAKKAEEKAQEEAKKAEEKALEEAKKAAEKAAEEAAKKEAETIKREEKIKEQLLKDAKAGIEAMSTIDYDKAYKYAMEMGLDEISAEKIARSITETKRSAAISKITGAIISRRLTMNQTREYALALGLSEEDANMLAELAFKTNESVGDIVSQQDYLDYLREQINKNK